MTALPRSALPFALAAVLAAGCKESQEDADFRRQLAAELRAPEVRLLTENGATLVVTLVNPPPDVGADDARRQTCRRVAEFVRDHYRGYRYLQRVRVAFATRREGSSVTTTVSPFGCTIDATRLGRGP
jgi:hypothetical protein